MTDRKLVDLFEETFGARDGIQLYSAPGRVELGGNHTDHQHGNVLAASINLDMRAACAVNGTNTLCVKSDGYPKIEIDLGDLSARECDKNTTTSLVRGIADAFFRRGRDISGADMYIVSDVLKGSGLSSSAAFEVLTATALSGLFDAGFDAVEIAKIGQYAETVHFGKPSGLMDQMACSVGGIVAIDFKNEMPKVQKIECNLESYGYDLAIIDAGADHADLTEEYASIPADMHAVASCFGKKFLADVDETEFFERLSAVRKITGDRAVLRAIHFVEDNRRAVCEAECLKRGDFDGFLKLVSESGRSSFMYLQNVYASGETKNQAMAYALAACEHLLEGRGAVRIQGGGFGGTVEAFVPKDMRGYFEDGIDKMIGKGMCRMLAIRPDGGKRIL